MRCLRTLIALAVLCPSTSFGGQDASPIPGRWATTQGLNRWSDGSVATTAVPVTAAQQQALAAFVTRLDALLRATPALKAPPGYEIDPRAETDWWDRAGGRTRANDPIPLRIELLFYELYRECPTCPIKRGFENSGGMEMFVNDVQALVTPSSPEPMTPQDVPWWSAIRALLAR